MQVSFRVPKLAFVIIAALVLAGALGVGGYYLGRASIDEKEIEDEAYAEGSRAGHAAGFSEGKEQGKEQAKPLFTYNDGYKDGGADALSLKSFDWQTGVLYIVGLNEGSGGLKYEVESQFQMDPTEEYVAKGTEVFGGPKD